VGYPHIYQCGKDKGLKMKKIKVLQFIHGFNMGGAETLVKDYALLLDKTKFDLTVLCLEHRDSPYEKLLADNGIRVIYACDEMKLYGKSGFVARCINAIDRYIILRKYIRKISPDIIHEHLAVSRYVRFARPKKPVGILYTHHNDLKKWVDIHKNDVNNVKWLINHYSMIIICLNGMMQSGMIEICGKNKKDNIVVLNNGINIEKLKNAKNKSDVRKELNIPDNAFVVGHVGRFSNVKNHKFLVEVFYEISKKNENAFLLMVGKGETVELVKARLKELKLENKYLILSDRMDVPDLMNAMDVMVFPSFSEGCGISLIEAQTSGLQCMVSDAVPTETKISNYIRYKSLNESASSWADDILSWEKEEVQYKNLKEWDMREIIHRLEYIYRELYSKAQGE
jgi:glycosyltransferase involved in cell wall biosynthesis